MIEWNLNTNRLIYTWHIRAVPFQIGMKAIRPEVNTIIDRFSHKRPNTCTKKTHHFKMNGKKNWLFIQIICWQTVCKQQTKQNKNLTDWIDKTIHYAATMVLISKLVVYIVCLLWMILIIGCKWASLVSVVNVHSI